MPSSQIAWPTLEWPKMPPAEMLVEPVQTATGLSLWMSTMNLLCRIPPRDFCGLQMLLMPALGDHRLVVVLVGLGLVADRHVRAGVRRRREGLADRQVAELVEHRAQLVVGRIGAGGAADEPRQRLEQTAREPDHLIGLRLGLVGLDLAELARIGLRAGDAAVEVDVVAASPSCARLALLRLGRDLDRRRRGVVELEQLRLAVHRHDLVAIGRRRLGGVVAPLEGLHRVLRGRHRRARREAFVLELESLDAAQVVALDDRAVASSSERSIAKPSRPSFLLPVLRRSPTRG